MCVARACHLKTNEKALFRGANTSHRTEFVHRWAQSKEVGVGFSMCLLQYSQYQPGSVKKKIHIEQQLHHRYLICLEGSDKASGLQWMLASNSAVLMPPPTVESWLIESRLEPWVHFIPIKAEGTDLEERLTWAKSHSAACRRITAASTDYVMGNPYYSDPARNAELEREVLA